MKYVVALVCIIIFFKTHCVCALSANVMKFSTQNNPKLIIGQEYTVCAIPVEFIYIGHGIDGAVMKEVENAQGEYIFGRDNFFNIVFSQGGEYDIDLEDHIQNKKNTVLKIKVEVKKQNYPSRQISKDPYILSVVSVTTVP